jgi:hypothetical protein
VNHINAAGQTVNLTAGGAITDANGAGVNVTANTLTIAGNQAVTGIETAVSNLKLTTAATSITNTGALTVLDSTVTGPLELTSSASMALNEVRANGQAVTLVSSGGAITDANGDATNLTASTLDLSARTGIGSGNALETVTHSLRFNNESNAVAIANRGALTVTGSSSQGSVSIENKGPVTIGSSGITARSAIAVSAQAATAGGSDDILTINGLVRSTVGDVTLFGADGVFQNANIELSGGGGSIFVYTHLEDDNAEPMFFGGGITMRQGVATLNPGGHIEYTAANDVIIGEINAGLNGTVKITAVHGNVEGQPGHSITAGVATVQAIQANPGGTIGVSANDPLLFAPGAREINLAFDVAAYVNSTTGAEISQVINQLTQATYSLYPGGPEVVVQMQAGTLFVLSTVAKEASGAAQRSAETELEDVDAALLKKAIKIYGVVEPGILLPPDQREDVGGDFSAALPFGPTDAEIRATWLEKGTSSLIPANW